MGAVPRLRTLLDVPPPEAVVRVGEEERRDSRTEGAWKAVLRLYRAGLHPAIALHVRHRGRVLLDRTVGHLHHAPGSDPGPVATPDSLFSLFSGSKIVTAALVHALVDDGRLDLDRPVADVLPDFGQHGKHGVRLLHLLNHTAGIPDMPPGLDAMAILRSGKMPLDAVYALRPQTPPGQRVAYHPVTAWFVVQELVEQATGKPLRALLRERLLGPLGIDHLGYGVAPARVPEVALHAVTGPPAPPVMARIFERSIGAPLVEAVRVSNEPAFLTAVLPSANVTGRPRDASRFMAMLLGGGALDGVRVLSEAAVRNMTTPATPRQFDATFGFPMRYGLGVMMGGRRFSLYGLDTAEAFGHLGLSNVVVFADPARDLVVSFLNTGKPLMDHEMLRWYWVLQRIVSTFPRR